MTSAHRAARTTGGCLLFIVLALLCVPEPLGAQASRVEALRWLTGCWERTGTRGRSTVERWEAPRNGMMLGAAYAVTGSIVRENEQLRLFSIGDTLVYEAHPGNQARTTFRATRVTANELVFHNPAHDFPQRITYRRIGRDSLIARIDGDRAGRRAPVTFAFARVACGRVSPSASLAVRAELQPMYDAMAAAEIRTVGGRMRWIAAHASPGYRYVDWTGPGSDVQAWPADSLAYVGTPQSALTRSVAVSDRRHEAIVQRVRIRGDTAEALVEGRLRYRVVDERGRYGPSGRTVARTSTERWIDTWTRDRTGWQLRMTAVVDRTDEPQDATRRNPE